MIAKNLTLLSTCLLIFFSPTMLHCQQVFTHVDEAEIFINSKIQEVPNPGKSYQQVLTTKTSFPGIITLVSTSKDSKGKVSEPTTYEFIIEHIDQNNIQTVSNSKELKLQIFATDGQKLIRKTTSDKTTYTSSLDIFCNDLQMTRDISEAIVFLISNTKANQVFIKDEAEAYNWLEANVKNSFSCNGTSYEVSIVIDRSNKNKITYSLNSVKGKTQKIGQYEFYLTDFNVTSFTATEKTDKLLTFSVDYGDSIVDYHIPSFDAMPFKLSTNNNLFSVNMSTNNQLKAVKYSENGVQKNFIDKFNLVIGNPKLAEDIMAVFFRLKTGNYDKEKTIKKESADKGDENYYSTPFFTTSTKAIKLTDANIKNYTSKTYSFYGEQLSEDLILNPDKTFLTYWMSNGGIWTVATGSYQQKNGSFLLSPKKCYISEPNNNFDPPTGNETGTKLDCSKDFGTSIKLEIIQDEKSPYYSQFLKGIASYPEMNTAIFGVPGTEPKGGEEKSFKDLSVIVADKKDGSVTAKVKMRSMPNMKASLITCGLYEESQTVESGAKISIVARSVNKEKVNKVDDYWYLVYFLNDGFCEFWIHGQYIKFN